ncbi:hypothetical protein CYCD_10590 [Tenuifilaceae bacterium CYCD]|nr:hypothetical protein CYCD_10590 [Tenuifilaceae bacterium CYCD]
MDNPIIHIGYPRTATTWFQKVFYPKLKNIYFIDRNTLSDHLIFKDALRFNPFETKKYFIEQSLGKRIFICEELLLGGLDIGYGSGEFILQTANKVKSVIGDAEIVVFIRNQHDVLESAYSQYIKSGGTYSVEKYLGLGERFNRRFQNYHLFNPILFDYTNIINLYVNLYGKENVYVFLYEDFCSNPNHFIDNYCLKFNIPKSESFDVEKRKNIRLTSTSVFVLRFLNHFTQRNTPFKNYFTKCPSLYPYLILLSNRVDKLKFAQRKPFRFKDDIHVWIEDYYKDKNRLLAEYLDIKKLKEYKYPL